MFEWLESSNHVERRTFWACLGGWALDGLDVQMFSLVIPALMLSWHVSHTGVGAVASVTLVASALGGWFGGAFSDYVGRIRSLQLTILVFAVATFVSAFAQNFQQLMAVKFVQGLGFGAEWAAGVVLVTEVIRSDHRGRALGAVQSGWAIGWGASVILYTAVFSIFPAETAWRVLFSLGLLPALLILYVRKGIPEPIRRASPVPSSFRRALSSIFDQATIRVTLVGILFGLGAHGGYYALFTWLPTFFKTQRHLSIVGTSLYLGIIIVAYWCGCVAAGHLLDRLGRRRTVCVFAAACVGMTVLYLQVPISSTAMLLLGFPLGFFAAGIPASMGTLFVELYPESSRGSGVGFCYNAGRVLAAGLPVAVGWMSDSMPLGTAIGLGASVSYGLVFIAALLLPQSNTSAPGSAIRRQLLRPAVGAHDAVR